MATPSGHVENGMAFSGPVAETPGENGYTLSGCVTFESHIPGLKVETPGARRDTKSASTFPGQCDHLNSYLKEPNDAQE